jgi:anaerobic selenocysteine-containing dehydrogenase
MDAGNIQVAMIHGDPVHTIPPATRFQDALSKVPFIVSFSSLMDDTALQADLILPDHAALESWGDVIPLAGTRDSAIGLMQPVVTPVFDTRQFSEVLMTVASELGGQTKAAFPYESYLDMLKAEMKKRVGPAGEDFEAKWADLLRKGGLFKTSASQGKGYRWQAGAGLPSPADPHFAGNEKEFPLHLSVCPQQSFMTDVTLHFPGQQLRPHDHGGLGRLGLNTQTAADLGISPATWSR